MLLLTTALLVAISLDGRLNNRDLAFALILILIGLIGMVFAASYAELYYRNRERSERLRKALETLLCQNQRAQQNAQQHAHGTLAQIWDETENADYDYKWFRRITGPAGSTHLFWIVLPFVAVLVGTVLTVLALTGSGTMKNAFDPNTIKTIATILSALVAIGALIVAFLVERRNQARFKEQLRQSRDAESRNQARFEERLRQSRELAQANIKPILTISSENYEDRKSVRLINRGIGPAVITKVAFFRGKEPPTANLVELFHRIDRPFQWETFSRLPAEGLTVPKDETIDLVRLSKKHLLGQGISEQEARSILARWRQEKTGIQVLLEYEDVLGNRQPAYEDTLK
jgi:hypothetical protein